MLFVLIMLFVLAAVLAPRATLHKRTALVIAPNGDLVEQYRSDPGSRALARFLGEDVPEVQLRDVLKAIKAATGDDRIERIVLRADTLGGAGMAAPREVADALPQFRAAGKENIAYGSRFHPRPALPEAPA